MTTIPFLGTQFNSLMPVFVVLLASFTLWKELQRNKKRLLQAEDVEVMIE